MSVIKQGKRRTKPFFMVARSTIDDDSLSWEARGILCYLLSKPENWTVRMSDLEKKGLSGKHVIRRVIKELINQGYMTREASRGEKGKLSGWDYTVYEDKQPVEKKEENNRCANLPTDGSSDSRLSRKTEEPKDGGSAPSNKESYSNKEKEEIPPKSPKGDSSTGGSFSSASHQKLMRVIRLIHPERPRENRPESERRKWKRLEHEVADEDLDALEVLYRAEKNPDECDETWSRKKTVATLLAQLITQIENAHSYVRKHRPRKRSPEEQAAIEEMMRESEMYSEGLDEACKTEQDED